uniref:glutathione transferase n=1 Tax=Culex tarsalis TaxID=7177 RepID=A0A1Q3FS93_CULTA
MDLYYLNISPPCWAVMMVGRELGVSFNLKEISPTTDDPLFKEIVKFNPQRQVPTLVDGNLAIGESRAMLRYLMAAYSGSEDHPLYPKDPKARAVVESRLDFDLGMLYPRIYNYLSPLWKLKTEGTEANRVKMIEALDFLEEFLSRTRFAAGDRLTIADISMVTALTLAYVCKFDLSKYPKIDAWYSACKKEIKAYEEVIGSQFEGLRAFVFGK